MSEVSKPDKFIVCNDNGLRALPKVIRKIKSRINTYSHGGYGEKATIFNLGWDDRPDSDWGRYRGHRLKVIVTKPEFARPVEAAIRKALGFPGETMLDSLEAR